MVRNLTRRGFVAGAAALFCFMGVAGMNSAAAVAQDDPREPKGRQIFKTRDGLALCGYDVVAYFTDNRAVKGTTRSRHEWGSAVWLFSNSRNLQLFKRDPARYMPEYGGYGAFGITRGAIEDSDPNMFQLIDNKLYLHSNGERKTMFDSNLERNIQFGNINWERIRTVINR